MSRAAAPAPAPRVLLVSAYDLGRQPWGLASPAAWLRDAGCEVACLDLALDPLDAAAVGRADVVAFHLPMHTATRLALDAAAQVRALRPDVVLGFYGLYAATNAARLAREGAAFTIGGEYEAELVEAVRRAARGERGGAPRTPLDRLAFRVPDRDGLPGLERYARLDPGDGSRVVVAYTEASRGCRHRCRHCPVVPVYGGRFRVVPRDVVLADVRRQVEAGAGHLTFGDPDFLNGPRHAFEIARAVHAAFPHLTWDATIKIEHLLRHRDALPMLRDAGCLFVTSAVESIDDGVLARLDKGHTRADFLAALAACRDASLVMQPTFVAFHPWIDGDGYRELLDTIDALDLVECVAPVQLALRLLIPAGSRLLELDEVRARIGPFDEDLLVHPWTHSDPRVDALQARVRRVVDAALQAQASRRTIFDRVRAEAGAGRVPADLVIPGGTRRAARAPVPYLTEPWYC